MIKKRRIAVVGPLGIYPMVRLSLPARRILAYLAIRGRPIARSIAAAELWPDTGETAGRANLRRAVWIAPDNWICSCGDEIALNANTDLAQAKGAIASAIAGESLDFVEILLLSEDILPGWQEEWILPFQDCFHSQRVQALEIACRTMTAKGDLVLAIQAGTAALAAEPLRESAADALILAHLAQHNRYEALRCYLLLKDRLASELGVMPDPTLSARFPSGVAA